MAFFSKMFQKKICDICGGEIGLLGNRKLEDGNMCKECAGKLSPWFDERRHSTIAQINEQLAYREENKAKVARFTATRVLGEIKKLCIDQTNQLFMVASGDSVQEWNEENPDVLAFSDITSVDYDVNDRRTEIKKDGPDGNQVSYVPPRYRYEYDFYLIINVRNPYFDDIRFKINRNSVEVEVQQRFGTTYDPGYEPSYRMYKNMAEEMRALLTNMPVPNQVPYGQPGMMNQQAPYGQPNMMNQQVPYGQPNMMNQQVPYSQPNMMKQQVPYGQPNMMNQQVPYGQPNMMNQQAPYGQPNMMNQQPPYGQPNMMNQQAPYGQPAAGGFAAGAVVGAAAAAPAAGPIVCPFCGATTTPQNGACEYCFSKIGG